MQAWSVPCIYESGQEAMKAVSQLALRPALEFIHSRGHLAEQQFPAEISIQEYARTMKNLVGGVPNAVGVDGKNSAVGWINLTASKCGAQVEFEFLAGRTGPCKLLSGVRLIAMVVLIGLYSVHRDGRVSSSCQPSFRPWREEGMELVVR